MGINEKIPIDITFPTRVAMELHKRGIKECDPQQLKVEMYYTVLITYKSGKKVIYEFGVKISRFGLFGFCFIHGKDSPLTELFKLPCNELPTVFGLDTKLSMKSDGLELSKRLMPGLPKPKIPASDFRRIVNELERWIKNLQAYFKHLSLLGP